MSEHHMMPIRCDLCGDPIHTDSDVETVTGTVEEHNTPVATVPDLIACPTCFETGPGVWINHLDGRSRTVIEPAWAL